MSVSAGEETAGTTPGAEGHSSGVQEQADIQQQPGSPQNGQEQIEQKEANQGPSEPQEKRPQLQIKDLTSLFFQRRSLYSGKESNSQEQQSQQK